MLEWKSFLYFYIYYDRREELPMQDATRYLLNLTIPQGPTGPAGRADTIQVGATSVTDDPELAKVTDDQVESQHTLNFVLPRGPQGVPGPLKISTAYLVTYHQIDYPEGGLEILSLGRIPIRRVELDIDDLCEVDEDQNTVKFNKVGYYKITITANAYIKTPSQPFDPTQDFIAIGFRRTGTDNVYIGASQFIETGVAKQVVAQGVIAIENTTNTYELVNLAKKSIYLNSPILENTASTSYFTNSLVTIVIEYLGRPDV